MNNGKFFAGLPLVDVLPVFKGERLHFPILTASALC